MLTIRITNDGEGTDESANYRYFVFVNQNEIEHGTIQGHNRKDGWAVLVKSIAERHITQRAADVCPHTYVTVVNRRRICNSCGNTLE